jgi:hypothetical protein
MRVTIGRKSQKTILEEFYKSADLSRPKLIDMTCEYERSTIPIKQLYILMLYNLQLLMNKSVFAGLVVVL